MNKFLNYTFQYSWVRKHKAWKTERRMVKQMDGQTEDYNEFYVCAVCFNCVSECLEKGR
jgi:succinate dehydrogenase/fumarate reductase-like Fe-S protein